MPSRMGSAVVQAKTENVCNRRDLGTPKGANLWVHRAWSASCTSCGTSVLRCGVGCGVVRTRCGSTRLILEMSERVYSSSGVACWPIAARQS